MIVKLVKCKDGETLCDLTIGREYEVFDGPRKDGNVGIIDDVGEMNELYNEEYVVISE